jgi:hypothetical protein
VNVRAAIVTRIRPARVSSRLLLLGTLLVAPFAFPQAAFATSVSDSFNRANGALGGSWTTVAGTAAPRIVGNRLTVGAANTPNSAYWSASTIGSNQFAQATLPNSSATRLGPGIAVRLGSSRGYFLWYGNAANTVSLWRMDSSTSWTQLGQSAALAVTPATDVWRITAVGSTIAGYQNGAQVVQATDASVTSGSPGVWLYYSSNQIGSWSGGDVAPPRTYTIGGTVSGLSGTAVLQVNGGGDLSVSSNGSVTFATPLATGTAYSVTVRTNPSGQTCTVSNGTGTVPSANVTNVGVTCASNPAGGDSSGTHSDDFNRADGPLGPSWTDESDGGLAITSRSAGGTAVSGTSGDIRTAESYGGDQYSQTVVTSTQLTGGQWIGAAVRMQNGGRNGYVGIYSWNNGNPELMLFMRTNGSWGQLGTAYSCGPLAAGTQLRLMVVGTTLAFMEDGIERIAAYDNTYAGGAPGIVAYGTGPLGTWSGGGAGFEVHHLSTDSSGVESYDVISAKNGDGPQVLRVLRPANPAPGVAHNFLYALPVEAGLGTTYGDGIATLQGVNAHNQYNLTIIEPSFAIEPWFADNPSDANLRYEAFMTTELQPWVRAHLATTGTEQHWLIGFSKSGIGGQDLLLKHPDLFTLAASWDFPADMSSYDQFGSSSAGSYGNDASFQANYRLTQSFLDAHRAPFVTSNRMWIGGYEAFQTDMTDYDALLTSEGIRHSTEAPTLMGHRWDGGWVPIALAALAQESTSLH